MGSEWKRYLFEDCMDAIIDYRGKTPKKTKSGIPLITAKIIKNGRIQSIGEFIAEEDYEPWMRRGIPENGDVVLTTEAPLGEVAQLDSRKIALAQRVITLRGKKDFLDNTFLKYLLLSNDVQHQLDGRSTGTTVKGIKQSELRKIELPMPGYETQKPIARILGSLDDKIELNRQTNKTLEKMAQALFKSWFVDFDPVIDNALEAGNTIPDELQDRAARRQQQLTKPDHQPLPDDIRQLFPSEFELTEELGWVPMGWEAKSIGEIIERKQIGKKYSSKTVESTGNTPVLDQGRSGIIGYHNDQPGFVASEDDPVITFANHTCYMKLIMFDFSAIQNVLPFKGNGRNIYWTYCSTIGRQYFSEYKGHWPDFIIHKVIDDVTGLDQIFGNNVEALFQKIYKNEKQNTELTKLRDTLLPKLISGELRLPSEASTDAEQQ